MTFKRRVVKVFNFVTRNYFISLIIVGVLFVGVVSAFKLFFSEDHYVYARVKVSQGLWWASTQRPSIWYVNSIKKGDIETSLGGKPVVEVVNVRYYPWGDQAQYDVYLDAKLKVTYNKKTNKYNFKRTTLTVASPIEFEFPSALVSGTVILLSEEPFADGYVEKTVYLTKRSAYPWEYDEMEIGDYYFDGAERVFEILNKNAIETTTYQEDSLGNYPRFIDQRRYITVKARIKVKERGSQLVFGEETLIGVGRWFNFSTSKFTFSGYLISGVE